MAKTIHSGDVLLGRDEEDTNLIYRREADGRLTFVRYSNQAFCDNLRFVDTQMPELLSYLLPRIDVQHSATFEEAAQYLVQTNPYLLPEDITHRLYPHRLASLAAYAAMGIPMTPKWNGRYKESYLQIQFKSKTQSYACIELGNLHVLYPSCRFYCRKEDTPLEVRMKVFIRYEE